MVATPWMVRASFTCRMHEGHDIPCTLKIVFDIAGLLAGREGLHTTTLSARKHYSGGVEDVDRPTPVTPEALAALLASHREFLLFVEWRVGDRALAEEILQDALVKSLDHVEEIRESAIGWFYRVLRNAIIDHRRRRASHERRLEIFAVDLEAPTADAELHNVVCKCVGKLADTLKPEYADALRRIDVEGTPVKAYADEAGISANNAGVRVFRAREALRKQVARSCGTCAEHGCLDCTCGSPR
jgi:RNA polymerase sigma factor (sigma-70 family)